MHPPAGSAAAYPVTLGYEMVSGVTEVAPDVTEVKVGDLVHTGTPHQEETVLDVADSLEATYPLVRLPTAERPERALFIGLAAVALPIRELNLGHGVDVAIEVSGSDRGLQGALEAAGLGGHGGGGRVLPGRGRQRAPGRGVPPRPAVADRLHRRLGRPLRHAPCGTGAG